MTTIQAEKQLRAFMSKAETDNDPYLLVHFSRKQDKYNGWHEGMDKLDAMIVIKSLVKAFDIDPILLNTAQKQKP